ncbi:MAG: hypothetical protein A3K65_07440 [Euryarchaeota archaeon RBG_16_68_12]|nr:MAG: hypothetical protein A3K65_07440 [Euryarchaeota archaeon RBG_16_68_12]
MRRMEFTAKPEGMGPKGARVFLDLPKGSAKEFGTRARVSVKVTVGGKTFRVSAFPDGEYVDWIREAKRAETREKRLKEAVARLERGEKFYD